VLDTAVFDVDGTLVDTNYHHVLAWHRAFGAVGVRVPLWTVHRAIGMGGDRLVAHVAGDDVERRHGDDVRAHWESAFDDLLGEVVAFDGASELLGEVAARGFKVVLASSGKARHVRAFLELVGDTSQVDAVVTSDDVDESKPDPDLVREAIRRVGGDVGILVGDSIWDCRAGRRAGIETIAVKTGGFAESELREAGAIDVVASLVDLRDKLDATPLASATSRSTTPR
jgi:HAD superfamily hydrolase (TIGR01549 family)